MLQRIERNKPKPPRILIYGSAGCGKTTFAVCDGHDTRNPRDGVIVIQTEDGLGTIPCFSFPLARDYDDVIRAIGSLSEEDHDFDTLVIDSLDWMEPLVWAHVCDENKWKSIEDAGYGRGYVKADQVWRDFFDSLNWLRDTRNMTIILTAHQQTVKVEDPELPTYDTVDLKLHKRAAALANEYADVILRASIKTVLSNDPNSRGIKTGKDEVSRKLALTTGQRIITTQPKPGVKAKNRYNLPPEMPLEWAAFSEALYKSF